ncbi:hypothetical protein [Nannocystis sp. SCPEA4]|uniref:hypothetical protein n=1 Tax=Nannocystis sp. SCPEA4 TaxID=2996787 RepID=UPI00226EB061|nr:hypothetical protein [Nannocystis sp. SCPEA4]MCY1055490.1 hypothetical protein [Nannocystis sp. SCPEA4]
MNTLSSFRSNSLLSLLVATACGMVGCGDDGTTSSTTEGPPPDPLVPGMAVDCLKGDSENALVCMTLEDVSCSIPYAIHYRREAICALVLGGTPADYDGQTVLRDVKLSEDASPSHGIDCANLDDILDENNQEVEVLLGVGAYPDVCSYCRFCENQLYLRADWEITHPNTPGWDELTCENIYDPGGVCDVEGVENPTTGEPDPTEGDPTEGDPTGGPEEQPVTWRCDGSTDVCATLHNSDLNTNNAICVSEVLPACVVATSDTVRGECFSHCEIKDGEYETKYNTNTGDEYVYMGPLPCGNFLDSAPAMSKTPDPVKVLNQQLECYAGGPMQSGAPAPFSATAELVFPSGIGGTATSELLSGLMSFTIGPCASTCEVSLDELKFSPSPVVGVYTYTGSAGPVSIPFTMRNLEAELLQPLQGELDPVTGAITFPGERVFMRVAAGETDIDSTLMPGFEDALFVTPNIEGYWDGTNLTLDLDWAYSSGGLQFSIELTTG